MTMRSRLKVTAFASALALSACGGGGGGSSVPSNSGSGSSGATAATFVITVPSASTAASSAQKKPQYVSTNTGSIRIALQSVNGSASTTSSAVVATIAGGASGCSTTTQGLQCTISVPAPIGTDVFEVSTYQSSNGSGAVLASNAVAANVSSSSTASSPVTLSLGGVPAAVAFSPSRLPLVVDGNIHRFAVTVNAADASGATIVGASAYVSPVTLQIQNDPGHALSLSTTSVSTPGTVVTVTYNSRVALASGQIIASDNSISPATLYASPLTVSPIPLTIFGTSALAATLSESGFTGSFTATVGNASNGSVNDAAVSITSGTLNSGSEVATITPAVRFDVTTLNVSDGNVTASVPLTIAPQHGTYTPYGPPHELLTPSNSFIATPDGTLWAGSLATTGGNIGTLYSFNPSTGAYTSHVVDPSGNGPQTFAADSSGNIWFADESQIGKYVPSTGTVNWYSTGLSDPTPQITTIIPGALGSNEMWFYDMGGNNPFGLQGQTSYIGSINTSTGAISEYSLSTDAIPMLGGLMPMVVGPDGAIWYADGYAKSYGIERFDPQNPTAPITPIPLGTQAAPQQVPMQLAVANNKIWALTYGPTSGYAAIAAIGMPSSSGGTPQITYTTSGIVEGPFQAALTASDGNVYFTQAPAVANSYQFVGIINPNTNAVYEYPSFLPQYSVINNLVDIKDGNLWMFDFANGQIGKVTLK